jgi:hypothetical protein
MRLQGLLVLTIDHPYLDLGLMDMKRLGRFLGESTGLLMPLLLFTQRLLLLLQGNKLFDMDIKRMPGEAITYSASSAFLTATLAAGTTGTGLAGSNPIIDCLRLPGTGASTWSITGLRFSAVDLLVRSY